jgi:RsiW-degrading membrane proteinase PrsW (M82 family)
VVVYLLALLGGVAGTLAAVWEEWTRGVWLLVVLVAPAIEEICKPIAIVLMLEKRPHWLRSGTEVVLLALVGSAVFSTLENVIYIYVYAPGEGLAFAVFRFTVCLGMHLIATAVFAVGLAKMWRTIRRTGRAFDIDYCFKYYVAAVVIHAAYNATVTILARTGVRLY